MIPCDKFHARPKENDHDGKILSNSYRSHQHRSLLPPLLFVCNGVSSANYIDAFSKMVLSSLKRRYHPGRFNVLFALNQRCDNDQIA